MSLVDTFICTRLRCLQEAENHTYVRQAIPNHIHIEKIRLLSRIIKRGMCCLSANNDDCHEFYAGSIPHKIPSIQGKVEESSRSI